MLTFLPRLIKLTGEYNYIGQQIDLANNADYANCEYCIYRNTWHDANNRDKCRLKHQCANYEQPFVKMQALHFWDSLVRFYPPGSNEPMYHQSRSTRTVTIKGWTVYLILVACVDPSAQCNANCWYHDARLQDKLPVSKCAHSHKCSRAGSFWDLLVPLDSTLRAQMFNELALMNP